MDALGISGRAGRQQRVDTSTSCSEQESMDALGRRVNVKVPLNSTTKLLNGYASTIPQCEARRRVLTPVRATTMAHSRPSPSGLLPEWS